MCVNRKIYQRHLPTCKFIREALESAVLRLLEEDYDLITLGGHEQAIGHRIAVYLQTSFPEYHTDCEYNRDKTWAKYGPVEKPGSNKRMRPDIIVHKRNDRNHNVLAIELKANANPASDSDSKKLAHLKSGDMYLYLEAAFVCIRNTVRAMKDGSLSATIDWYGLPPNESKIRSLDQVVITSDKHAAEVTKILKERKAAGRKPRT